MYNYNVISVAVFKRRNLKNLEITRQTFQYQASKFPISVHKKRSFIYGFPYKITPTVAYTNSLASKTQRNQYTENVQ